MPRQDGGGEDGASGSFLFSSVLFFSVWSSSMGDAYVFLNNRIGFYTVLDDEKEDDEADDVLREVVEEDVS